MSTKKPLAIAKATSTKPAKVVISPPAKKISLYHLDTRDAAIVAYYSNWEVDYAKVEVHVNGGLPPGTYRYSLAENGMTISFSRGISAVCFDMRRFRGAMGPKFSKSSSRVMAFGLRQCCPGHVPQPIESRKSYQSVNPYYVWTW